MLKKQNLSPSYIKLIRNVGIVAHIDAGKTTVTERILFQCKQIHKIGEVHEGSTLTDYAEQERKRGITIYSATVTVLWSYSRFNEDDKQYRLNIIDSPGHIDFNSEVESCLHVLDGAIVVMDAKEGVEQQTEKVWRQADRHKIPRIVFVNKMDSVENEERFDKCLISMRNELHVEPLAMQIPIGSGKDLQGVIDLIEEKAYFFQFGDKSENYSVQEVPPYLLEKTHIWRKLIIDTVIEQDDNLAAKFLEGQELDVGEIRKVIRKATLSGNCYPVFCGSAYHHVGIKLVLDAVIDFLPSPSDVSVDSYRSLNGKKIGHAPKEVLTYKDPISYLALAFKVTDDKNKNRITFIRVYVGEISENSYISNVNRNETERVATLVTLNGEIETRIKTVRAGEIAAIKSLKHTFTGDTFCSENILLEPIAYNEPVIAQAIIPHTKADVEKLGFALEKLNIRDPSFKYSIDSETNQVIIRGAGDLHLQILIEDLRTKYNLKLTTELPMISYRETIKNTCEVTSEYIKQSGGHGHYARIMLRFEPNPGKGFEFVNKIRGEAVSKKFAEEVGKGLEEVMSTGLLLSYPMNDVKATLLDGKTHPVDSAASDFRMAAVLACRENKDKLGLALLEPIMDMVVKLPSSYMGDVLADLGSRRMSIENIEENDKGIVKIRGKIPLKDILSYDTILRQLTQAKAEFRPHLSHYQEVPKDHLDKIIIQHKGSDSKK